jgi:hypothetical protein
MKKILTLALISFYISASAQITVDHVFYNAYNMETVNFTNPNLGEKFFINTEQVNFYSHQDTIKVFNSDYTIYKTIPLPLNYVYTDFYTSAAANIPSLSDQLFNSDSLLEFLAVKPTNSGNDIYSVINELGQTVYTFPDTSTGAVLFKIAGHFKMGMHPYSNVSAVVTPYTMYGLPGSIPCSQCSGLIAGIEGPSGTGPGFSFNAYPNPFNNTLNINYNMQSPENAKITLTDILGRELMNLPITKQSDNLSVSTSGLPAGVIIISVIGSNGQTISKKLVKIQ